MVKAEITYHQIKQALQRLSIKDKIRLSQELHRQTWKDEFRQIIKNIRSKTKNKPISQKEINQIVEEAKEEYHAVRRR